MQLRSSGLTWQVVDDEVVVLDLDGSVYLRLNGSGRLLWEQLATPTTAEKLSATLVDEYGIDAATAARDVDAFLQDLRAKRLIQE